MFLHLKSTTGNALKRDPVLLFLFSSAVTTGVRNGEPHSTRGIITTLFGKPHTQPNTSSSY